MNMDDPWGSPWAQPPTPGNDEVKTVVGSRPQTPTVTAATLPVETSPWADEDVHSGDWPGTAVVEGKKTGAKSRNLQLDGFGGGWSLDGTKDEGEAPMKAWDNISPAWGESTIVGETSPGKLAPSPQFSPAKTPRQSTPNLWDTESASGIEGNSEEAQELSIHGNEDIVGSTEHIHGLSSSKDVPQKPSSEELHDRHISIQDLALSHEEAGDVEAGVLDELKNTVDSSRTLDKVSDDIQEAAAASSRPSSSPSDNSRHDEIFHESPRTSLDEEPKQSQATGTTPSNVKELVQYFDGRAKQEVVVSNSSWQAQVSENNPDDGDDGEGDDFGDFEEGNSETGDSTPDMRVAAAEASTAVKHPSTIDDSADKRFTQTPKNRQTKISGPVQFTVDTVALEKLYPSVNGQPSTEPIFIPDTVPHDSFSSAEERKTWYRLSRYGSMRKHNSGDEDNYTRINWQQSSIRAETLKIVGRWMEEDRISGRVVLGGGSKGSSIFGWNDPKAEALPLSSVFAARKSPVMTKTPVPEPEIPREWPKSNARRRSIQAAPASTASPGPKIPAGWPKDLVGDESISKIGRKGSTESQHRRRSSAKSPRVSQEVKPVSQVPIATFGWSAASEHPPAANESTELSWISELGIQAEVLQSPSAVKSSASTRNSLVAVQANPTRDTSSPVGSAFGSGVTNNPYSMGDFALLDSSSSRNESFAPKPLAPTLAVLESAAEDDEWGEMVSSPITTSPPVLSDSKSPNNQGLQNIGDAFSFAFESGPGAAPAQFPFPPADDPLSPMHTSLQSNTGTFGAATSLPPANNNTDPWASADFSFFDSAPAPVQNSAVEMLPKAAPPAPHKHVQAKAAPNNTQSKKSKEKVEVDNIVQSIIRGLPDLSYMLKR